MILWFLYLCGGLSALACSLVLLSASAIHSGSSASAWTVKEVRSSGLCPSEPWRSTTIHMAVWDRLGLYSCSGKTAVRQERSEGAPAGLRSMLLSHCRPKLRGCFKTFAPKNQVAFLINQDQFIELSCTFCTEHDQEMCFHLSPAFSCQRGHFNSSALFNVSWASFSHLCSVQPPGAELKQHLFSLERK